MKKIKLNGKLILNKETISKLNDAQMRNVRGEGYFTENQDQNEFTQLYCTTNVFCPTPVTDSFCPSDGCPTQYFCPPPKTK